MEIDFNDMYHRKITLKDFPESSECINTVIKLILEKQMDVEECFTVIKNVLFHLGHCQPLQSQTPDIPGSVH